MRAGILTDFRVCVQAKKAGKFSKDNGREREVGVRESVKEKSRLADIDDHRLRKCNISFSQPADSSLIGHWSKIVHYKGN